MKLAYTPVQISVLAVRDAGKRFPRKEYNWGSTGSFDTATLWGGLGVISQTAQDIFRDPIWQGIGSIATVLALLLAILIYLKQSHAPAIWTRIIQFTLIAVTIISIISFFPITDKVTARFLYTRCRSLGDSQDAISICSMALSHDPEYAEAYFQRAWLYDHFDDTDRAIMDLNQAIKLSPDSPLAYNNRGWAYRKKDETDRAIADFAQAIKLRPNYSLAYVNRGDAYDDKGEYDLALTDINQAIKLKPDYPEAYNTRGVVYFHKGIYDRAIADFEQAILFKPDYDYPYYGRGSVYESKGETAKAIADYRKFLELSKDPKWRQQAKERLASLGAK